MVNKVVARYKDGKTIKGQTSDFFPNKNTFHLEQLNGEILEMNVEQLKAVFFVRDFNGNKDRQDSYTDTIPGGGRKLEVLFLDGERMIGYSQGYSPHRPGFILIPADKGHNNDRVFIIASATKKVTLL